MIKGKRNPLLLNMMKVVCRFRRSLFLSLFCLFVCLFVLLCFFVLWDFVSIFFCLELSLLGFVISNQTLLSLMRKGGKLRSGHLLMVTTQNLEDGPFQKKSRQVSKLKPLRAKIL